ncbi:hypothetical protein AB0H76_21940 [Nocardia sp. NPDC050712]|uniref:hypothetical protein n=1 Tax=Nocardia sp. NPDC050712 TaxID=3155518 RepID=UPI0033D1622C
MLLATIIVSTLAFLRRRRTRPAGDDSAVRAPRAGLRAVLRRPVPVLAGAAALAFAGAGGSVLMQC